MPAPVFYSLSPYGADPVTHNLETGAGDISITSGVATLTVAQTGNIGVGVALEYNSLKCYIAPNRIAFTSGGTVELLTDTKITGVTSGATGIVRFVEVTGGTWAGGDAAGWLYFESTTGTWNSSEQINRTKPTASTNIATTNGSIEGNIGNGNTQFVVKSAVGGTPANQSATAVTSVHHEYASLFDFEAGFTDASHINNTSLVAADVVSHACCYYDHDDYTADSAKVVFDTGTTDSTRYLVVYAPAGGAESINRQKYLGVWDANKYKLVWVVDEIGAVITSNINHVRFLNLQVGFEWSTTHTVLAGFRLRASAVDNYSLIDSCFVRRSGTTTSSGYGIETDDASLNAILDVVNCVVSNPYGNVIFLDHCSSANIYHSIVYGGEATTDGIERDTGTVVVTNCCSFHNLDDYDGDMTVTYSAADDAQTGTGNIQWLNGATDWANIFNDHANGDYSLNNFTGTGAVIEQGTDLSSSEGIWRDIAGNERDSTPDIGAFEYMAAAPSGSVTGVFYGPLVGPFGGPV